MANKVIISMTDCLLALKDKNYQICGKKLCSLEIISDVLQIFGITITEKPTENVSVI